MNKTLFIFIIVNLLAVSIAKADCNFSANQSDEQISSNLYTLSDSYKHIVSYVESRQKYNRLVFVPVNDGPPGNVVAKDNMLEIQLNKNLTGVLRVSVLIFEVSNSYFNEEHREIDSLVSNKYISTAYEFGLAHEIYEYEAIRMHNEVLGDLYKKCGELPKDFYYLVSPAPATYKNYRVPELSNYLMTQKKSSHTSHYYNWFNKI